MTRAQVIVTVEFLIVLIIALTSFHPLAFFAGATWIIKLLLFLLATAITILIFMAVAGIAAKADKSKTAATTIKWIIAVTGIMIISTYWRGDWTLAGFVGALTPVPEPMSPDEVATNSEPQID